MPIFKMAKDDFILIPFLKESRKLTPFEDSVILVIPNSNAPEKSLL